MSNEAAERLRSFLGRERPEELRDLALHNLLDAALDIERKNTADGIGEAFGQIAEPCHECNNAEHVFDILDAEGWR